MERRSASEGVSFREGWGDLPGLLIVTLYCLLTGCRSSRSTLLTTVCINCPRLPGSGRDILNRRPSLISLPSPLRDLEQGLDSLGSLKNIKEQVGG